MLAVMSETKKSIQGRGELEYIGLLCSSRFVLVRVTSSISPRFVLRPTPGSHMEGNGVKLSALHTPQESIIME